jgi:copper chaperone
MKDITLAIGGMSCGHCLNAVNQAIHSVPGVEIKSVRIGQAELRVPESGATADQVKAAIEDAGYKVEGLLAG